MPSPKNFFGNLKLPKLSVQIRKYLVVCGENYPNFYHFYRAMHVVLARYCYRKSSVCLSVCL